MTITNGSIILKTTLFVCYALKDKCPGQCIPQSVLEELRTEYLPNATGSCQMGKSSQSGCGKLTSGGGDKLSLNFIGLWGVSFWLPHVQ